MILPASFAHPCYHDDDAAREAFEAIRWPDGPYCPHCGRFDTVAPLGGESMGPGWYWCNKCREKFTARVGWLRPSSRYKFEWSSRWHGSGGQGWKFRRVGGDQRRGEFGHPFDLHVSGAGAATRRFAQAGRRRSAGQCWPRWGRCRRPRLSPGQALALRLTSLFKRSNGFVECSLVRCWNGKAMQAGTSCSLSSISAASLGQRGCN